MPYGYSFRQYTPFSRMQRVGGYLDRTTTPFERTFYNTNPEAGYQRFLDQFNFGTSQQQAMQSLYDQVLRQWTANQAHGFGRQQPVDWLSYLANNVNWQHELARLTPQQRHEDPGAFMRAVRTISIL